MSIQLEGTSAHQLPTTNEVQTPVTPTDLAIDELVDDLPISQSYGEARYPKWRQTLTVTAAFIAQFTPCGLLFSFAVYQAHYETLASQASTPFNGASSSEIDLIGSISVSLMTMGAPFAVAWAKYFGSPRTVFAGGILVGLANILASFGKALWHFQLSQGLLMGTGASLSFSWSSWRALLEPS